MVFLLSFSLTQLLSDPQTHPGLKQAMAILRIVRIKRLRTVKTRGGASGC